MIRHTSLVSSLSLLGALSLAPRALAAGDMLTPDEVQHTGVSSNPANDSALFLQGALGFGQARSTEESATPGLGVLGSGEVGYQFSTGSWSRVEVSGQFLAGTLKFRTAASDTGSSTLAIGAGVLAKIGWGYSLGNHLTGVVRVGAGPLLGKFSGDQDGVNFHSDGTVTGLGLLFGYDLVAPMTSVLDGVVGFDWLHTEFDVNDIKASGATQRFDHSVVLNVPQALLGLRIRL